MKKIKRKQIAGGVVFDFDRARARLLKRFIEMTRALGIGLRGADNAQFALKFFRPVAMIE